MLGALVVIVTLVLVFTAVEVLLRLVDIADPPSFVSDSHFGYLMHPNQSVSTRGYRFKINNIGLRGSNIDPKGPQEHRLMFIGDSITYGGGAIRDSELFVTQVASHLSEHLRGPVTTVNASAPGWGIQNMAGFVAARGLCNADLVVWVIPSADFARPMTSLSDFGFPKARVHSRVLYAIWSWLRIRPRALRASRPASQLSREETVTINLDALENALQVIRAAKIPVILTVLPSASGYGRRASDVRRFRALAESKDAAFIDLENVVRTRQASALFSDGVHLTRYGHRIVAEALLPVAASLLRLTDDLLSSVPASR